MPTLGPSGPVYTSTDDKALGWDVEASAPYTLAVDGVSTTILTTESTLEEIEIALNETSQPVGLDVAGDTSTSYSVSTDTPAVLTGNGANVTVTDYAEPEVEPPTQEEAINLAYAALTGHRNQSLNSWPAQKNVTELAVAALAPYQTVEAATVEQVGQQDDGQQVSALDLGRDPDSIREYKRQQRDHAKAQFDAVLEHRAFLKEAAKQAQKDQEEAEKQDEAFRDGIQRELERIELEAIAKQEALPVNAPAEMLYVPKPSQGIRLDKVPGRSDKSAIGKR
jgi:hypothetical protein